MVRQEDLKFLDYNWLLSCSAVARGNRSLQAKLEHQLHPDSFRQSGTGGWVM